MKSKTLELFKHYNRLLKEQGEDMTTDPTMGQDLNQSAQPDPSQDVTENPESTEDVAPLTSVGENQLIQNVVDAALFKPSPEQFIELQDFQNKIKTKNFTNARTDILTPVLTMISDIPADSEIKQSINQVS